MLLFVYVHGFKINTNYGRGYCKAILMDQNISQKMACAIMDKTDKIIPSAPISVGYT